MLKAAACTESLGLYGNDKGNLSEGRSKRIEEEKCPHAVYQRAVGKGMAAVLLPASARGPATPWV